ncbi:PAS domain-containing sensor histidine kinase [Caballeronia sp. LZ062]|uniref:PAS domain-containing sensor histidine kinase n=1 Tax=unclassified Caballeronia TaxID=2646786 RepID=UPI0028543987|nr:MULTISPECIES: PAS domain-containing sensor histidine kinase [unclassified Caballeronia]MDR5856221.1 PAS domain-containing sensor histidine kinase [Caballeronia sp. LZ050]MDR5872892.1 PAS domain-containing sensor histidine kinase [Caballeronia sp. LZ062]
MNENNTSISAGSVDPGYLFAQLTDAYLVFDADAVAVFANRTYLRLFDRSAEDTIGQAIHALPEFAALANEPHGSAWLSEILENLGIDRTCSTESFRFDLPPVEKDKPRRRFWKFKASRIPEQPADSGSNRTFLIIRVSDMTARAEREIATQREKARLRSQAQLRQIVADETAARLRAQQEQFAVALAFAKVGAWELDPISGEITCTDQCKINLGLTTDDTLSEERLFTELIAPEFRTEARSRMESALAERRHFETEYRVTSVHPVERWLLVRGQGQFEADGTLKAILGFTIDITARKRAELEQQRQTVVEREAREESDRYALAMDHFVSAVTHELRSPLSAITSWAALLARTRDVAFLDQAAGALQRNARQLSLMVDDLLDTGAIVSGKLSVNRVPVAFDVLVDEVVGDMRWEAERKGISIVSALEPCLLTGDEARLKQVVWNLLSNAIKFTQEGTITVALRKHGDHAVFTVQDTGCGIEASALPRVFDRFQQVRSDVAGRIGGLGLGLWLVRNLVNMHEGTVAVESEGPGRGSVFQVTLPLRLPDELANVA